MEYFKDVLSFINIIIIGIVLFLIAEGLGVQEMNFDLYDVDWHGNAAIITDRTKPNEPKIVQLKCTETGKDITKKQFKDGVSSSNFNNACRVLYSLGV